MLFQVLDLFGCLSERIHRMLLIFDVVADILYNLQMFMGYL